MATRVLGLGCMRLSTSSDRDDARAIAVIHAALDAGVTLLDTADAYAHDDSDIGHNERLIARALGSWSGDRSSITVATKGGMRRPGGDWVLDGRARHLRAACDASRQALGVDTIDLYQLHAVDPKTPIETSVRALARLRDDGSIRDIGLCNVTVNQIRVAQAIAPIASVQVALSPLDDENLRNGVAEYCRDAGIRLLAHRPLGGTKVKSLARHPLLRRVAEQYAASAEEVAIAWLLSFGPGVIPLPGATRVETATSLGRALALTIGGAELVELDGAFAGTLLRTPRGERRPRAPRGDVVIVMGMPGAGKSVLARGLEFEGYTRLNRDTEGGSLRDLAARLQATLQDGNGRVVLDNTYPTRHSRNDVIETAWRCDAVARCVWLETSIGDAQINAIMRMVDVHGSLPSPEEIRERQRGDARYLLPDAQFRYERTLEPPGPEEGFESVERRAFARASDTGVHRAIVMDFDDLVGSLAPTMKSADVAVSDDRVALLTRARESGWLLFVHAWRPQVERGDTTAEHVTACLQRLEELLGAADSAYCPHDAGPPRCWCRKPIPGSVVEFALRRDVSLSRSIVVGLSAADRTMAERLGAQHATFADLARLL